MDAVLTLIYRLLRYLPDVCMHFVSSGAAGLLVWRWTWTTSWALWSLTCGPASRLSIPTISPRTSQAGRYIYRLSWAAALFFALLLHYSQDTWLWLW